MNAKRILNVHLAKAYKDYGYSEITAQMAHVVFLGMIIESFLNHDREQNEKYKREGVRVMFYSHMDELDVSGYIFHDTPCIEKEFEGQTYRIYLVRDSPDILLFVVHIAQRKENVNTNYVEQVASKNKARGVFVMAKADTSPNLHRWRPQVL